MDWIRRHFNQLYWIGSGILFLILVLRCAMVPFSHDEVATFYFYIQPGQFLPFLSHVDANGHFLMSATAWLSYSVFGSSALALRLPNLLAFLLLCYAVFKTNQLFSSTLPKLILSSAFIGAYQFFAFYTLCRGYAMSMSCLVMALYYLILYSRFFTPRHLVKFALFIQLALAANLTLIFVCMLCAAIVMFVQWRQHLLFRFSNAILWLCYTALLIFWIKYAFYLQEQGALYYGGGESYWKVTFLSLIQILFGYKSIIPWVLLAVFLLLSILFVTKVIKEGMVFLMEDAFALYYLCFVLLVVCFYLLKKLFHVNYPEDRTGLFFYVFFILSIAFLAERLRNKWRWILLLMPLAFLVQFAVKVNVRSHPWRIYETFPQRFMDALVKEEQGTNGSVTIAGHRLREFIFGFMNYNDEYKLNHITSPEALQMNCDFAIAYKSDKPYYDKFYAELDEEQDWGFVLLKRKTPLQRHVLTDLKEKQEWKGEGEYYNAFELLDSTFTGINPLEAEFSFSVNACPVPFNAWLVIQIDSQEDASENVFVRVPFNLIQKNWNNGKPQSLKLVTGNIPKRFKRLVCYLWNIDKKPIDITLQQFKLSQLRGRGVTYISKAAL